MLLLLFFLFFLLPASEYDGKNNSASFRLDDFTLASFTLCLFCLFSVFFVCVCARVCCEYGTSKRSFAIGFTFLFFVLRRRQQQQQQQRNLPESKRFVIPPLLRRRRFRVFFLILFGVHLFKGLQPSKRLRFT